MQVATLKMGFNYGLDTVRFPHPVVVGSFLRGLVTVEGARQYGLVIGADRKINARGTKELRASMRESCEKLELFDKGGDLASIKKRSLEETGFEPPKDPSTR